MINQRIGWVGRAGPWQGALWIGGMFQDLKQTLDIQTTFMGIPVNAVIEERAAKPWNFVTGGSWHFNRHLSVAIEAGFGEREHWMASLGGRF